MCLLAYNMYVITIISNNINRHTAYCVPSKPSQCISGWLQRVLMSSYLTQHKALLEQGIMVQYKCYAMQQILQCHYFTLQKWTTRENPIGPSGEYGSWNTLSSVHWVIHTCTYAYVTTRMTDVQTDHFTPCTCAWGKDASQRHNTTVFIIIPYFNGRKHQDGRSTSQNPCNAPPFMRFFLNMTGELSS